VRRLETGHFLIIIDEANHLDIEAMELLRYVYDRGRLGVVLIGTLRLYEIFTNGSRPASELEQLWSRVGICELLPGLTEYEARQIIQQALGRIPDIVGRGDFALEPAAVREGRIDSVMRLTGSRWSTPLRFAGDKALPVHRW
jgi:DNA transposition AAA+ family ATPase